MHSLSAWDWDWDRAIPYIIIIIYNALYVRRYLYLSSTLYSAHTIANTHTTYAVLLLLLLYFGYILCIYALYGRRVTIEHYVHIFRPIRRIYVHYTPYSHIYNTYHTSSAHIQYMYTNTRGECFTALYSHCNNSKPPWHRTRFGLEISYELRAYYLPDYTLVVRATSYRISPPIRCHAKRTRYLLGPVFCIPVPIVHQAADFAVHTDVFDISRYLMGRPAHNAIELPAYTTALSTIARLDGASAP